MNGANRLVWTIALSASGLVVAGFMAWMASQGNALAQINSQMVSRGERLASLEANYKALEARLGSIELVQRDTNEKVTRIYAAVKP